MSNVEQDVQQQANEAPKAQPRIGYTDQQNTLLGKIQGLAQHLKDLMAEISACKPSQSHWAKEAAAYFTKALLFVETSIRVPVDLDAYEAAVAKAVKDAQDAMAAAQAAQQTPPDAQVATPAEQVTPSDLVAGEPVQSQESVQAEVTPTEPVAVVQDVQSNESASDVTS